MSAPSASDFITAVLLAMNPDQHHSSPLLPAALQFVNNVQSSPDGWQLCLSMLHQLALTNGPPQVSFFCLQTLTTFTATSYFTLQPADRQALCTSLMIFLRDVCPAHPPSSFLRNKLAALFTLVCQRAYPELWVSYFSDLIGLLQLSPVIVDIVLRILLTIDTEIVVYDSKRTDSEVAHNSRIKDHVRSTADMTNNVNALYSVLSALMPSREHEKLVVNGLKVVKEYTGWIDIGLVANERWVTLLYSVCTQPVCEEYRALALACVREMCDKKMDKSKKVDLIASYRVIDMLASLPLRSLDEAAAKEVGALLVSIGKQLLESLPASSSAAVAAAAAGGDKAAERVREMVERAMGLSYTVLETCEWQTVDESGLLELIKAFIRTMTASSYLLPQHQLHARRIFHAISEAMLFPPTFAFPTTLPSSHSLSQARDLSDIDAAFLEFRSSLHVTFSNLVPNMPDLSVELTAVLVSSLLARWREEDWRRVEGALRLFYDLGEALKGGVTSRILDEPMSPLLASLLRSDISSSPHAPVVLVYQLIVHRYARFLEQHPDYLPSTLSSFLDQRGLHHPHAVVRSKACYLLYKLLLSFPDPVRKTMRPYVDGMIGQVQGVVDRVLKSDAGVDVVSGEECQYLCEVLGVLVSASVTGDACVAYVTMLLNFFASHLSAALAASSNWAAVAAATRNASLSPSPSSLTPRSSSHPAAPALSALSTASTSPSSPSAVDLDQVGNHLALLFDSFGNVSKPLSKDTQRVSPLFDHCCILILQLFAALPSHDAVRAKTIFVIHRMVECQGARVLTHVQAALGDLVRYATVNSVASVLPLFSQMVISFKVECLDMLDSHFIPLCSKVMDCLNHYSYIDRAPSTTVSTAGAYSTDRQERLLVQQRYYQFIKTLLLDFPAGLTSPHNAPHLFTVCDTLIAGWKQSDSGVQKTVTQCLALLLKHAQSVPSVSGDEQLQAWACNKLTPELLSLLVSPAMQLSDAGCMGVFRELVPLLRALCGTYGDSEVRLVMEWLVGKAGWSEQQSRDWIELLREGDSKKLSEALKRIQAERAAAAGGATDGSAVNGGLVSDGKLNGNSGGGHLHPPMASHSGTNGSRQADLLTLSRSNSSTTSSYHSALSR